MTRLRVDWAYVGVFSLVVLIPLGCWVIEFDPRVVSAVIGFVAFSWLALRLVGTYDDTPSLARAAVFLIMVSLFLGAIGQLQLASAHSVQSVVAYPVLGQRVGCLLLAAYWHKFLDIGAAPPFLKFPR